MRLPSSWSKSTLPAAGAALGPHRDAFLALGALRQRRRPAVQHDGAGAARLGVGQRRQPAARRGDAADVGADLAGHAEADLPVKFDHQRRPRADVDVDRDGASVRRSTSAPTGSSGTTIRRCGIACCRFPTRSSGRVRQSLRSYLFTFIRERARQRWSRGARRQPRASSPPARCSIRTR